MKVYQVVYERDGETVAEPGKRSTEIQRMVIRYAAGHIEEVWEAIEWIRGDVELTLVAILEESPAITVLGK